MRSENTAPQDDFAVIESGGDLIHLDSDRDTPLSGNQIESYCRRGYLSARMSGRALDAPLNSADAERFLKWLACLREMTACGVPVSWQAGPELATYWELLAHIAPPETENVPAFEAWRRAHRYGICYWRAGPRFSAIVDRRKEKEAHHYILDTAEYLDVFTTATTVVAREALLVIDSDALNTLEQEGLILSLKGWSLTLPFRMRHWPVPFSAI